MDKIKLGYYGHSYARSVYPFTKLLAEKLKADIVNFGVIQGSEERIVRDLKATKSLDVAVIFHSYPVYVYLPKSDRDFNVQNSIENRADSLWKNQSHLDLIDSQWDLEILKHPKFYSSFKDKSNFKKVMEIFKQYFYDYNLINDRFVGSLMQINSILTNRKILSIHLVDSKKNYLPKWFEFSSGIVDNVICSKYFKDTNPNSLSEQDNRLISEDLYNLVIAARSREVHTPDVQSGDGGSNPPAAPKS